jgi:hypothetical protein
MYWGQEDRRWSLLCSLETLAYSPAHILYSDFFPRQIRPRGTQRTCRSGWPWCENSTISRRRTSIFSALTEPHSASSRKATSADRRATVSGRSSMEIWIGGKQVGCFSVSFSISLYLSVVHSSPCFLCFHLSFFTIGDFKKTFFLKKYLHLKKVIFWKKI